jgi:hypothetical protein
MEVLEKKSKPSSKVATMDFLNNEEWVELELQLRCLAMKFFNFKIKLPLNSTVAFVKRKILEHHKGTVEDVMMYRHRISKENDVTRMLSLTLEQLGYEGQGKEFGGGVMYYDFIPTTSGNFLCVNHYRLSIFELFIHLTTNKTTK